jgi:hypothetical protein
MFKDWEWEDTGLTMFCLFVLSVVSLIIFAICQDHSIRFYYLIDGGKAGACVAGHRNWTSDSTGIFCSPDAQNAAEAAKQFNEVLATGKARK